ncbi:MAG: Hint domain-containing protein [Chloroflexi bacterium]|nr:Hint domain-containing protein [Chloroflexota bacterium]MCI0579731.1 Hint domain-containing protein [Chloroflexota bacterium]MCI0644243.1 Hint domain-containing protein [Chloroflexota bacterium]
MTRLYCLLMIGLAITLAACSPEASPTDVPRPTAGPLSTATATSTSTATAITLRPTVGTAIVPEPGTPGTYVPPTQTPVPTLPGGLSPTELKYRLLEQFPDFFFCDPDYYPIQWGDELERARQRFPELQANTEEFNAILAHNNLAGLTTFSDEQKLLIYREHKKLAAIQFQLAGSGYRFQIQVAKTEGQGELVSGVIDAQGVITVEERTPTFVTCPICLAAGTLISTPAGPVPVQSLRPGMLVWTVDKTGARVARPLVRLSQTAVPATHQVVRLVLADGRQLWLSPGHPTTDGRTAGQLQVGDSLDGAVIVAAGRVPYAGLATYDLLPAGDTGFYWANGVLLASTLVLAR